MITFEEYRQLLISDRTVRKFDSSRKVSEEELRQLVELTRYCASGRNAQPIRYRMVTSEAEREQVYPLLKWAGYYTDWDGPEESQRPAAYLVQCQDLSLGDGLLCDDGLQLQAITLGAKTLGLDCCIIKAFNSPAMAEALGIGEGYRLLYVLAIGKGAEEAHLTDIKKDGDFKYFRNSEGEHCVPKRNLNELIIK